MLTALLAGLTLTGISCHKQAASRTPLCCAKEKAVTASLMPGRLAGNASIYQLPGVWTDQHDRTFSLDALKGKVQVVAMIFTHCGYACPRIVREMRAMEDSLSAAQKQDVGFVLVSFDAARDDPAQLAHFAEQQGLDDRWILLHGSAAQVRELSLLLNVRYQRLEDGNYIHSNTVVVLDRQGGIQKTLEVLGPAREAASSKPVFSLPACISKKGNRSSGRAQHRQHRTKDDTH